MTKKKCICKVPFSEIEVGRNGRIVVCCPAKMNFSIGNVYEKSFDEIWHSKEAQYLRKDILSKKYTHCDLNICNPLDNIEQDKLDLMKDNNVEFSLTPPYPKYVKFCHDNHCNIQCITCRDCLKTNTKEKTQELDDKIESVFLPILKNCEVVSMNGAGEVFASKHMRNLVKAIVKAYPNIKFDLHTNGILCDKRNCDELGITDKIISIDISMHAVDKETYQKIMVKSDYERVLKNIEWLSGLKKSGQLKRLDLYFVVQKMNYKEMGDFVKFAQKYDANTYFWEYRNWGNEWGDKNYANVAVHEKYHKEYNELAEMLKEDIFKSPNCYLNNLLKSVKPIKNSERLKHIIRHRFDVIKRSFLQMIFSLKNTNDDKYKILRILGIKIKLKREHTKRLKKIMTNFLGRK